MCVGCPDGTIADTCSSGGGGGGVFWVPPSGGGGGGGCPPVMFARRAQIGGCTGGGGGGGGGGNPRDISQGTIWQNGQFEVLCGMYSATYDGTATVFGINSVGQKFAGTLVIPKGREQWGFLITAPTPTGNAISIVITGPAGTATCGGSA